ncbi:MAG TPA: glucose 1-dehydrogenase [Planctomycetota bacterium]|nr:glucose 1-dehydrogenase [Planctomycetota bacterium]
MKAVGVSIARREVRLLDHPEPRLARPDEVKIRILEVGVCGTDREICEFKFGEPPAGSQYLVLGHEAVAEVVEAGTGVRELKPGTLVVPMVRLPCTDAACAACIAERQDFCLTDRFPEHGIRRAHGFMTEKVVEREKYLVPVGAELREVAVLVEPLTIMDKALRELDAIQKRMPFEAGRRGLVLGAGPVGLLGAMALRLRGFETTVVARSPGSTPNARLAGTIGARYISSRELPVEKWGSFDVIYEAAGSPAAALESLGALAANGVLILTGVPGAGDFLNFDAGRFVREVVLRNQLIVGTVNAGRVSFTGAIASLRQMNQRWPQALRDLITSRSPLESFGDLLLAKPAGIKNVLVL